MQNKLAVQWWTHWLLRLSLKLPSPPRRPVSLDISLSGERRKKINIKTNFRKLNKNTTKRNRKIALHFYIVVCCKTSLLRPNWLNDYPEWLSVCLMYYLLESDEQKMENGIEASHISVPSHWIVYVCVITVWAKC